MCACNANKLPLFGGVFSTPCSLDRAVRCTPATRAPAWRILITPHLKKSQKNARPRAPKSAHSGLHAAPSDLRQDLAPDQAAENKIIMLWKCTECDVVVGEHLREL